MTGPELKRARTASGLTQQHAAARLRLSQPYLSQLEKGRRAVTPRVAQAAAKLYALPPTSLPKPASPPTPNADPNELVRRLAALGYPGYGHLDAGRPVNPAYFLLEALSQRDLDARLAEALPWVMARYPDLDWYWLESATKLRNLQNRVGFLVTVARQFSERKPEFRKASARLKKAEDDLERARLAAETTLARESMPAAERAWLRAHRPREAAHWNVLTTMSAQTLSYVE
jgi:transcriptional regulator with XRE-family HTH domain